MFSTKPPYPSYFDKDGAPLNAGFIYFGSVNQNPETNPITVYWDEAGTQPAAQPVRTIGGYPARMGAPANIYSGGDFSITVKDKNGVLVYTSQTFLSINPTGFIQAGSGTVLRTTQDKERDIVSVLDYAGNTDAKFTAALVTNAVADLYVPPGTYSKALPIYLLSPPTAPQRMRGAGREKTIIEYEPAAYDAAVNFAVWVGDHTNDVVLAAYGAAYPEVKDMTIQVGQNAAGALRSREVLGGKYSNLLLGALDPTKHPGRVAPGVPIVAGAFIVGQRYKIVTVGTTNFIAIGAAANTVGLTFQATGVGAGTGTASAYFWGLMCESNLNTTYEDIDVQPGEGHQNGTSATACIDVHQSRKLDPNGGNTSVSTTTTTRFNNCYAHYAADLVTTAGSMTVTFDKCVFEAGARGVTVGAQQWPLTFNDCHWEAISTYPLDVAAGASVIVNGGYYGPAGSNIGSGLIPGDTFCRGTNASSITIKGLAVGGIPQASIIASSGSGKIILDALTRSPTHTPTGPIVPAGSNITTVNGSPQITVHQLGHGLAVGAVVGLRNFGTVGVAYRGLLINQPFYRVLAILGPNEYTAASIWFPSVGATSAGTQASTGAEEIWVYPNNCWLNCVLQEPDYMQLNDCYTENLVFNQAFGGAAGDTAIYYGGITTGQKGYTVDDWTYVMSVQGFSSANPGGAQTAGVTLNMANGYDTGVLLGAPPTAYAINAQGEYQTILQQIGLKIPPGSSIGYKSDCLGASNLQGRIVIARTGMR